MKTTTPLEITKQLKNLVNKISPGQTPIYIPVVPEPNAIHRECFPNVETKVNLHGGEQVIGWMLWEWSNVLVEAEFHSVWRSPEGNLIDITPKPEGEKTILFVPDQNRKYQGILVDNVRHALRDDMVIDDFIKSSAIITSITRKWQGGTQSESVSIPTKEIGPFIEIQEITNFMLMHGLKAHNLCACGSGGKYKRCHGKFFN